MKTLHECRPIREVLEVADTQISAEKIAPGLSAIVVQTKATADGKVEGTLVFFPGVDAEQLMKGFAL